MSQPLAPFLRRRLRRLGGGVYALLLVMLLTGCAATPSTRTAADLINSRLAPGRSQWLVGAIGWLASDEEIAAYLALTDDTAAATFEEAFWQRRDPDPTRPGNPVRETFETRAREADRRFAEAGYLGRRTDRGVLLVLHGEPEKIDFEISPLPGGSPIEVWSYPKQAAIGLDGRQPAEAYRFYKPDDLTVLYRAAPVDPDKLERRNRPF